MLSLQIGGIEYRRDDITKNLFFAFQHFGYHVLVEHDEKHPQPKMGGGEKSFHGGPRYGRVNT